MSSLSSNTPSLSTPSSLSLPLSSLSSPSPSSSPSPTTTPVSITTTTTPSSSSSSSFTTASSSPFSDFSSTVSTSAPSPTSTFTATASAIGTQQQSYSSPAPTSWTTTSNVSDASSPGLVHTSPTSTPSHTATSSSSSGFFSNTGAVAGTFTVIGLVGIAGLIAVALLIIRRRQSRSYEEDMEYLDKTPDLSLDPPTTQPTSPDDGFTSDHGHYAPPPMPIASPPTVYYPDHAYALHPQAFSADTTASRGYPAGYTQGYTTQHNYSQDNYHTPYPPSAVRLDPGMPNPHEFAHVELASTPAQPTQTVPPHTLRPSVPQTSNAQKQWANTRFSVDSFYAGIAADNQTTGQA